MNRKQNSPSSEKTTIVIVASLLGVGVCVLIALLVLLFRGRAGQQPAQAVETLPPAQTFPSTSIPQSCGQATLSLGETMYRIEPVIRVADGSIAVRPDTPDVVYWVEGTDINHVFVLSPTPNNLALETMLKSGDGVTVFWEDCRFEDYTISSIQSGQIDDPTIFDQSAPGLILLLQAGPSAASFVIRGSEAQNTNTSSQSAISADLSLLDTTTSPDGTTIRVGVAILNFGASPFTITDSDVSLTPENAEPLRAISAEPPLPQEIQSGATQTIYFTFPHSSSSKAVLKVLGIEFDLP